MRTNQTNSSFSISFSIHELWFLMQFFTPGVIFGVDDPYSHLKPEEKQKIESKAKVDLENDNIIKLTGNNQYMIDELIGSMIYSCIHSSHTIQVKDELENKESWLHFLPNWQLNITLCGEQYTLTIFKEREYIWSHIIDALNIQGIHEANYYSFSVAERDLELASYLYSEGKRDKGIAIILDNAGEGNIDWDKFLSGYISPNIDLTINSILYRNDADKTKQKIRRFLKLDNDLFWVIRSKAAETDPYFWDFERINQENIIEKLSSLIPDTV